MKLFKNCEFHPYEGQKGVCLDELSTAELRIVLSELQSEEHDEQWKNDFTQLEITSVQELINTSEHSDTLKASMTISGMDEYRRAKLSRDHHLVFNVLCNYHCENEEIKNVPRFIIGRVYFGSVEHMKSVIGGNDKVLFKPTGLFIESMSDYIDYITFELRYDADNEHIVLTDNSRMTKEKEVEHRAILSSAMKKAKLEVPSEWHEALDTLITKCETK